MNLLIGIRDLARRRGPAMSTGEGILPNLICRFNLAIIDLCQECVNFKLRIRVAWMGAVSRHKAFLLKT